MKSLDVTISLCLVVKLESFHTILHLVQLKSRLVLPSNFGNTGCRWLWCTFRLL